MSTASPFVWAEESTPPTDLLCFRQRAPEVITNGMLANSLAYSSYNTTIDIYGTLDMGQSRWTVWSGAAINLRGGEVVGVGEGNRSEKA